MLSEKELDLLYQTLLSAPGMGDVVKLDIRMPRKSVLLLSKVIEKGLDTASDAPGDALVTAAGANSLEGIQQLTIELLQKAGLSEMHEKLQSLQIK